MSTAAPETPFTIYDVLRHLIGVTSWAAPGMGDIEEARRKAVALQLVDRLETFGLLGTVADTTREEF